MYVNVCRVKLFQEALGYYVKVPVYWARIQKFGALDEEWFRTGTKTQAIHPSQPCLARQNDTREHWPRRSTGIPHGVCTPLHRRLVDLLFRHPQTWCVNKHSFTTTYSHSHSYTTGYFIMSAKTSKEFRNIPVGKVSVYMHVIQRWR